MAIKFESERIPYTAVNNPKCDYFGVRLPEVVAYVNRTTKESFPRSGPGTSTYAIARLYDMRVLACIAKISRSRRQESTQHITIPVTQSPK